MKNYNILKNKILFQKYKIIKKIGKGAFGFVFNGINLQDNSEVAIKVEKKSSLYHLLEDECNFLSILKGYGIPEVKSYGYNSIFYYLVLELLGKNLLQVSEIIKSFSLKDIIMIAIQAIERIEFIHKRFIIHRDIKPENFLLGYNNSSIIYLIDFGMARKYKSSRTGKHLKYSITGKLFGTFRYLSYNASRGVEQSRRDDLESIGYMLVYLKNGTLPWKGLNLKASNIKQKYIHSVELKRVTSPENICKNLPQEFADYLRYCRNLGFEDDPDYNYLINLFKGLLIRMKENNDSNFTWNKKLMSLRSKKPKEDIKQHPNFFKRKESPHSRLFKAIKASFNSKEKISKTIEFKTDLFIEGNQNSYHKEKNEELLDINDNLDEFDLNDENISFNSNYAQYNMKLANIQDLGKIDKKNINQKKNLINKINIKKDHKSYEFQLKNSNKNYNITENNKRKINKDNIKNNQNINIIINQNLSNSTRNIANNFSKFINKNNNELSEFNSFNKKIMINPKNINLKNYKIINKSPTNIYKKGDLFLSKPSIYKSKFKNLSLITQGNYTKNGLIKKIKISKYKPMHNAKQKSDILYNKKDNESKHIIKSISNIFFNPIKIPNDMNNNEKIINIKKRIKKLPYQYSVNNILKNNNVFNFPNDIRNPNLGQRSRNIHKSASYKIDNNEINFGLKSQIDMNNFFGSKNDIKSFIIAPKKLIHNNLEELKTRNINNLKINRIKKNIPMPCNFLSKKF